MQSNELYFKRQIQLLGQKQENLKSKSIAIIGCGGLGNSLAIALGSSGIECINLVDFDTISLDNIHRQISFELDDIGKPKAEILANFIKKRNKNICVNTHKCDFNEFIKKNKKVNLILDATDNLNTRADIDKFSKSSKIPWIYSSVEEFNAQVCFFEKSSFKAFKIVESKSKGIATPMVMQTAAFAANLALMYLADLKVQKDFLYYLYFQDGRLMLRNFKFELF